MGFPRLDLKKRSSEPLYQRLVGALEEAIDSGELAIGARLPSERALADKMKVSRTTVIGAYRELEARGLVHSQVGRGTFVSAGPEGGGAPFAWRGKVSRAAAVDGEVLRRGDLDVRGDIISFAGGAPAVDRFPMTVWHGLIERGLREHPAEVLVNGPTAGLPRLRRALAERVGTKSERILVLSGSQQGLALISRCLLDPGDAVIIDRPCYIGAIQVFRAAGAHLIGWDLARADMGELEELIQRHRPKLIFTNPTFHNPTGRVLSLRERRELLHLAARYRIPVLEDDPYRETHLDGPPPPTLRDLDTHNVVIYLGTFSKTLAPGLRLGWLVAPESIVDQLALIKQREALFTEGAGQYALSAFLQSGQYDDHLVALRREHALRRDAFRDALRRHAPARLLKYELPAGGLYFWCRVARSVVPSQWSQQAYGAGVSFTSGEVFYADGVQSNEARFCFTRATPREIGIGVQKLMGALKRDPAPSNAGSGLPLV